MYEDKIKEPDICHDVHLRKHLILNPQAEHVRHILGDL